MYEFPQVASRDCNDCQKYLYNEETGAREYIDKDIPYERHAGCPPPCRTDRGCPKGTPEKPNTLSEKNVAALNFWEECDAVGSFPDDAMVRHNAVIIKQTLETIKQRQEWEKQKTLYKLMGLKLG